MNRSGLTERAVAQRIAVEARRSRSSIEAELAEIAEELAAMRDLSATFDPDSPPWSAEADLRRLELRFALLMTDDPHGPPPAGGTSNREGRSLLTAA